MLQEASTAALPAFRDPLGRGLARVAWGLALASVVIIAGLAVMLVVTIVARKLLGWQVTGDHEIVRMFAAVSLSMMFPWCHIVGGNIVVDLLTAGLPSRVRQVIDRAGSFMLGLMALLLAWRTGALSAGSHASGAFSPLLAWPVWIFQALMLPGMVLTALTAFYIALMPGALAVRDGHAGAPGGEP